MCNNLPTATAPHPSSSVSQFASPGKWAERNLGRLRASWQILLKVREGKRVVGGRRGPFQRWRWLAQVFFLASSIQTEREGKETKRDREGPL